VRRFFSSAPQQKKRAIGEAIINLKGGEHSKEHVRQKKGERNERVPPLRQGGGGAKKNTIGALQNRGEEKKKALQLSSRRRKKTMRSGLAKGSLANQEKKALLWRSR